MIVNFAQIFFARFHCGGAQAASLWSSAPCRRPEDVTRFFDVGGVEKAFRQAAEKGRLAACAPRKENYRIASARRRCVGFCSPLLEVTSVETCPGAVSFIPTSLLTPRSSIVTP